MSRATLRKAGVRLLCLVSLAISGGCVAVGGTVNKAEATTGQQLIDLKRALDCGAVDQAEYERLRSQILGCDKSA